MLKPFLSMFDVTWGATNKAFGTTVSTYFLRPEHHTREAFGFEREVLLVYSPYRSLEARVSQLVEQFLTELPARGRVETLAYVLVSDDPAVRERVSEMLVSSVEARTIVPFTRDELHARTDPWLVRNRISETLFSRDLFDISQALVEDTYYFGRKNFVTDLIDRFKRGHNTGLFGLRKSGKTSTIFKVRRNLRNMGLGYSVMIDAQTPACYGLRWWELLRTIVDSLSRETGITLPASLRVPFTESTGAQQFNEALDHILCTLQGSESRVLIIIDEVEHITPQLSRANHWNKDFLPFWQTLRAYQNTNRNVAYLIVGVNPHPAELTVIDGVDNPIFGLIPPLFLPPFSRNEVREMVRTLGRYMGMRFEESTYDYLRVHYGGHPLLIRLACSWMHKYLVGQGQQRPLVVTPKMLQETQTERDYSLFPYTRHILDVLTTWYPLEYELLEMLCQGYEEDYEELVRQEPNLHRHLVGYGLVSETGSTTVQNGLVKEYVRSTQGRQKRSGARSPGTTEDSERVDKTTSTQPETAGVWTAELEQLADTLIHSRTYCNELAAMLKVRPLFDDNKSRLPAKLADVRVTPLSNNRQQFQDAINTLNQVFWDVIPSDVRSRLESDYPTFHRAVNRVRSLRHWMHHSELSDPAVREVVSNTFMEITDGYPSTPTAWQNLHLHVMRELVDGLREVQQKLFLEAQKR